MAKGSRPADARATLVAKKALVLSKQTGQVMICFCAMYRRAVAWMVTAASAFDLPTASAHWRGRKCANSMRRGGY